MRAILFTLMSIVCTAAISATVYKWVDDDGVVHYSDQPHENAQKVQLKAPQTYSAQKGPATTSVSSQAPSRPARIYQSCQMSAPTNDQVFPNATSVTAGVNVQPTIRPGDQVIVTMDGARLPGVSADGGPFTISPIDRGSHSIQASIQDPQGQTLCQSAPVTFHVMQASILNPKAPVRPR
jgi:hypothetical protein